ncbi:MAG: hypothetical protein A2219_02815 [Elusimicrobia bacterium RIFOXYA2_FULL_50_26]|nr:MAG: hypothetical protein A2219_02815 [Elusimicrobia bacterium RIFOXYA2_FULL_50_26]OGS25328.1 MAG: hypothetical protein A2314_06315 [Elusimicrobia bacterium RIFOXYB2_FULL_50_12]
MNITGKLDSSIFTKIIFLLFLILVVFTPVAFGSTQPWAIFVFEAAVSLMAVSWLLKLNSERTIAIRAVIFYVPLLLFILLVLFELIPLPAGLVKNISLETYQIKTFAHSFFGTSAERFSLSIDNYSTLAGLIKYCCYFIVFFLGVNELKNLKQINLLLAVILVTGFIIAVFAIIQKFTWSGKIFWLHDVSDRYGVFGPFVNYDHYGGYINMVIMVGFGFILSGIEASKKVLVGFMVIVMGASLLLSQSRGAVISFLVGLTYAASMLFFLRKSYDKKTFVSMIVSIIAVIAFVLALIYWIDWGVMTGRLSTVFYLEKNYMNPRLDIWRDSLELVRRFPVFGVGFDAYSIAFPMVQETHTGLFWRYTHNDYLQLLIESGPLALILVLSFFAAFFVNVVGKIKSSSNEHLVSILVGASAAVVTMLVHSLVDFNLHITSNAFLFALVTSIALSLVYISRDRSKKGYDFQFYAKPAASMALTVAGIGLTAVFIMLPAQKSYAAYRLGHRDFSGTRSESSAGRAAIEKAAELEPNNALWQHRRGLLYQRLAASGAISAPEKLEYLRLAQKSMERAVTLSPAMAKYWASYAWLSGNLRQMDKSKTAFERAVTLAPNSEQIKKLKNENPFS